MAEVCVFEESCPVGTDIIEVAGACSTRRGENCGKVAAYGILVWQWDKLTDQDEKDSIKGMFTVTQTPGGFPPKELRQAWVGVQLPVRNMEGVNDTGEIKISPADAILSLYCDGKMNAAEWFIKAGIGLAPFRHFWIFQVSDGELQLIDPITSVDYYGSKLSPKMREAVEQAVDQ
jgi:hypothetical protein